MSFSFQPGMDCGVYMDGPSKLMRFVWDGKAVTAGEFGQRIQDLKLQNEVYRKALEGIASRSCCDEICIGPCASKRAEEALGPVEKRNDVCDNWEYAPGGGFVTMYCKEPKGHSGPCKLGL